VAFQLFILDAWTLEPLDAATRHNLLEILEERWLTIITSQIPIDKWQRTGIWNSSDRFFCEQRASE
jgi:hypothetical protein